MRNVSGPISFKGGTVYCGVGVGDGVGDGVGVGVGDGVGVGVGVGVACGVGEAVGAMAGVAAPPQAVSASRTKASAAVSMPFFLISAANPLNKIFYILHYNIILQIVFIGKAMIAGNYASDCRLCFKGRSFAFRVADSDRRGSA